MPSVGTAYVNIRVSTKGFEASLDKLMSRLSTKMEAQGTKLGKDFERGLKKTNFDTAFSGLTAASEKATDQVANDINKITTESREAKDAVGDLSGELRGAAASSKRLNLGSIGGGGGSNGLRKAGDDAGFFSNKLNELISEAPRGVAVLNGLFTTAAFGGTALAGLVGGLSAAAQGIFAIGANAASAAPALGVLASGLTMVGQLGAAVGISMQGVGNAITAGLDSTQKAALATGTSATGMASSTAAAMKAAARAVRDAKDALVDAYRAAARAAEDAARRTQDAERALAAAQVKSTTAQKALNAARKVALEQMEDIGFAAEDAGLQEQRAALALQDAQAKLVATSELAPDDRTRVEAQLAYQEAELNMRQATDARQDADKEQREIAKKGIEGTDAMKNARSDLADAHKDEADAQRDLNDARRDEARVAVDNADRIAKARQNVADAEDQVAAAQKKSTTQQTAAIKAADKYNQLLKDLSPQQRIFVKRIIAMRGAWIEARKEIADPLFKGLNDALTILTGPNGSLGILKQGLIDTSGVLGDFAVDAANLTKDPLFKDALRGTMKSNNKALGNFGDSALNLADAFLQIADAAGPVLVDFSEWTKKVTASWKATARADNHTGKLDEKISKAAGTVKEWWGLLKQVGRTMKIFGGAANTAMEGFNDDKGYIPTLTDNLTKFNDQIDKNDLVDRFSQSLENLNAGAAAVKAVVQPFIDLGSDPNVAKAFTTISESDAFDRLGQTAGDALPDLAEIVVNIADLLANISESNSISHFLKILTKVTDALVVFTDLLAHTGILKWTGYITAGVAALKLLWKVGKIGASPFVGLSKGFKTFIANVRTARKSGKGLGKSIFGSIGKGPGAGAVTAAGGDAKEGTWEAEVLVHLKAITAAVETSAARIVVAVEAGSIGGAAGGAGGLLGAAPKASKGATAIGGIGMAAGEVGKVGKFAGVLGKMSKVAGPLSKMMKPLSLGVRALGGAFRFALGPIGMIVLTLLPVLWPLLVKLDKKFHILDKVMAAFQWTLDGLTKGFKWLWEKLKDIFGWIKKNWPYLVGALFGPFGIAIALILKHWDKVLAFIKGIPAKVTGFLSGIWDTLSSGLATVWGKVKEIWGNIVTWVKGRPDQFVRNMKALWSILASGLRTVWKTVREIWGRITTWIKGRPDQFVRNLKALWNIFKDALSTVWEAVKIKWGLIKAKIVKWPGEMATQLAGLWSKFKSLLDDAWTGVTTKWANIKEAIAKWPGQMSKSLAGMWDGFKSGFKDAYEWVAKQVNGKLIGGINKVLGFVHAPEIPASAKLPETIKLARGGPVFGPGGPTADRVPAWLSNGEHVLTAAEVRAMGGHKGVKAMRQAAVRGGTGGLFGAIKDKYSDIKGALSSGVATAVKWALGKFDDVMNRDDLISKVIVGAAHTMASSLVKFGKNEDKKAAAAASAGGEYTGPPGGWTYPLARRYGITQYPNSGHNPSWSVDIGAPAGVGVRAASVGTVSTVRSLGNSSYGNYIVISHAGGQQTLYAHLRSFAVKQGQKVKTGQTIGYSDSTGHSTGNHLHFELKPSSSTIAAMSAHGVKLAHGGVVAPSASGTMALLAEAGHHERVTPLDSEGFTPAERRMLEALESNLGRSGGGDQYHVHPAPGMNEAAIADMVMRRAAWKRRRGAGRR
jgi:murein DD-endopeptidase MepM/ murein hydrolase activator NlpD